MVGRTELSVTIVGAGFGGIGAAIELRKHGITDVTILERATHLGGTWWHNTYPGCACDVPSHLYSYSFAQRKHWSRLCSPQQEILDYLQGVADDFDITGSVRTGTDVTACRWDDTTRRWTVESRDGRSWESDALIVATGQLHQPAYPRIDGIDDFAGHSFHSAQWDHDHKLAGRRVAVVGTGASAVQFVPAIAPEVGQLTVFQRTGNWFLPRKNHAYPGWLKTLFRTVPGVETFRRSFVYWYAEFLTLMIRHPRTWGRVGKAKSAIFMRIQLRDPEVRRKVWPDYTFGCKRVLFSSWFLKALQRDNVTLVDDAITRITPTGLLTADGVEHDVDTIIWGTGFKTTDFMFPMEITGVDGRSLRDAWADGPHAYLGMTVPDFPSLFVMYGPNTNTSGGSIIFYLEAQAAYIRQALELVRDRNVAALAVRPEIEADFDVATQARFGGTAWLRCDSWYRDDATGRNITNWPGYMREYADAVRVLDVEKFTLIALPEHDAATSTDIPA
ncbi:NAD(P)/FAD-dependent oxidoreductase [Antrihabitans sp. YC3-6]|uniref:NAD(P)/FAD-dependent oxidoreductase n=1 Tax=Antrihabitans stalagmiti TaxID=2799499 RepID=A0A934U661_9NOCA|nr:NAD(P)/FAD-dependent oxidoreductase [Antrihabitans stalagmiti]MBJ8342166.1 NAD(P)/FAD-dependent oxidoreductase [Antrihabitans stalagmiti]